MKLKYELGIWKIRRIDGEWFQMEVKSQWQAKSINKNMKIFGLIEWVAPNFQD